MSGKKGFFSMRFSNKKKHTSFVLCYSNQFVKFDKFFADFVVVSDFGCLLDRIISNGYICRNTHPNPIVPGSLSVIRVPSETEMIYNNASFEPKQGSFFSLALD